jgi:hypothetical protein
MTNQNQACMFSSNSFQIVGTFCKSGDKWNMVAMNSVHLCKEKN